MSNAFKDLGKLIDRHEYVEKILNKAKLTKKLSPYRIQILALTRQEDRRKKLIYAQMQPGYKPPERKPKSSKGGASKKKRSATTTTPLATKSNVKSRTKADDDFIVGDDDDISECSWNSSDEESEADEQDDDIESDDEFDKMMLEPDDDESVDDINLDSDAEDAGETCFGCTCGKDHGREPGQFWVQCDGCDDWYYVANGCVGFDYDCTPDNWYCPECTE